jgi:hypothetical protein
MYAFGGGWQVMGYVWENIFKRTTSEANWWYAQGEKCKLKAQYASELVLQYWWWTAFAGCGLAGLSQYLAALAIVAFYCVVQFLLLVIWAGINSAVIAMLAAFNFLYGNYFKIFFRCPDCHEQMNIPIYVCPMCGTEHSRLWPSVYGVFYHRCSKCNTSLPTLDVLGREGLVQKCAVCKHPMNKEIGRLINIHIPVVGGPSTGKSNYIFMATNQLIEQYAHPRGLKVSFPDENHQREYESNLAFLGSGRELVKTPNVVPQAYNLAVKKPEDLIGRILYIYDAAGEAYAEEDSTLLQTYYKYVHGLIFIIDPFAIEFYRSQHESEINSVRNAIRPSTLSVMDAYGRMLTMLESCVGIRSGQKFNVPIAVIISKTDALGLEKQIGQAAITELLREDSSIRFEVEASRRLIEQFLEENQLGNLIRDLDLQFEHVGYFACSALGRMPKSGDLSPYEPVGVLEPLLWLLGKVGVVGVREELVRRIDEEDKTRAKSMGNIFAAAKFYYWDSLKHSG